MADLGGGDRNTKCEPSSGPIFFPISWRFSENFTQYKIGVLYGKSWVGHRSVWIAPDCGLYLPVVEVLQAVPASVAAEGAAGSSSAVEGALGASSPGAAASVVRRRPYWAVVDPWVGPWSVVDPSVDPWTVVDPSWVVEDPAGPS